MSSLRKHGKSYVQELGNIDPVHEYGHAATTTLDVHSGRSHPAHPACPARSATQVLVPVHNRPVEQAADAEADGGAEANAEADAEALEMWM